MTKLTETEVKILDDYFIANNYTEMSEAHFFNAIDKIFPTWRSEELAGERVYEFVQTSTYRDYIKKFRVE